jgi:hypothetical protein
MTAKVYTAGEVAYILRQTLGPLREWSDCLADMRQGKTSLDGIQLLPICRIKSVRQWRPAYDGTSIASFIHEIRALHPEIVTNLKPQGIEVDLSPTDDRAWFVRKLPTIFH